LNEFRAKYFAAKANLEAVTEELIKTKVNMSQLTDTADALQDAEAKAYRYSE